MFSNDKKASSAGVSNWFSSLRRQPKKQKSLDSSKLLQKSCGDLNNIASTSTQDLLLNLKLPPKAKFDNNNDENYLSDGNLCTNCCCKFTSGSSKSNNVSKSAASTPLISDDHDIETVEQFNHVVISSEENYSSIGSNGSGSGGGNNNSSSDTNTSSKFKSLTSNFNSNILLYNKKEEFSRTVKTTTTKVTTKLTSTANLANNRNNHHRVGLVFNDSGQLLNRRLILNAKHREGLVFDENGRLLGGNGSQDGSTTSSTLSTPLSVIDDSNIEFIDSATYNDIHNRADLHHHHQQHQQQPNKFKCNCNTNINNNKNSFNTKWNSDKKQIKDELCEVVSEMESHDSQEDSKHSNKDKQMSIGRKKFNMDPKKGIEYLYENHLLKHDPQDVAQFLYKGEGLNKTAIGDYLGEKNEFNEKVLKAFVELHDFTDLILVQALRQFLWSFRLPGEAQKIDRMMECFAQRYCQLNPQIFTNTDTCYVLSFAIIMLNTSLHNQAVKDKPTVEQFISMNRGINNGGDLPRELLESLYESIKTEPFKIPQDDGNDLCHTFFNPDKEGWLWKQGGRYKSWKRRWFILNDNCLYYFEYTTDKEPRGIIPLENISVREITDRSKPHCFELFASGGADIIKACKTDSEGKVVEGKHTVYRMSAATEEEKLVWIKCLNQSISHNPFYDILVQRKKKALAKS